jgi:hypothetical protein
MLRGAILILVLAPWAQGQKYASNLPVHHRAIHYGEQTPNDPVAQLQRRLDAGKTELEFTEGGPGYLPSVLKLLGITVDSQALVFSKTSFQAQKISPRNPRAIYFNDEVSIGFLRGQAMEVASIDPRQGVVFYTLTGSRTERPRVVRAQSCLRCHQGAATAGVPGIFVGSVFPGPTGLPDRTEAIITDHRTPFADRWGGWYVNAKCGQQADRSNAVAPDPAEPQVLASEGTRNILRLDRFFNSNGYLSPVSDIVALMTFEHQTQMVNLFTRLGWLVRIGADSNEVDAMVDVVADYMLFKGEAPLTEPIEGVSSFSVTFPERGPRDRKGRSLREFDLGKRLFKYPLSYLIYSAQFDALPEGTRKRIYGRIFAGLAGETRRPVIEIVCDTKADVPASWCNAIASSR